jgi:hypothetical protein
VNLQGLCSLSPFRWKPVKTVASRNTHAVSGDICTSMFIAALVTIANLWNQHRHLMTDEWITKVWHIPTEEYYTAIKNDITSFAGTWMEHIV